MKVIALDVAFKHGALVKKIDNRIECYLCRVIEDTDLDVMTGWKRIANRIKVSEANLAVYEFSEIPINYSTTRKIYAANMVILSELPYSSGHLQVHQNTVYSFFGIPVRMERRKKKEMLKKKVLMINEYKGIKVNFLEEKNGEINELRLKNVVIGSKIRVRGFNTQDLYDALALLFYYERYLRKINKGSNP